MELIHNIKECKFLSSVGLFLSCDKFNIVHYSNSGVSYDFKDVLSNLKDGIVITIRPDYLKYFIYNIMQKITCKFILMTCDCDTTMPFGWLDNNDFSNLINNDYLIRWYSVNCIQETHYKLTLIPIGINLHSIALNQHKTWKWTDEQLSPLETEKVMISIKNNSKPFYERKPICYSNFHFELRERFNNPRKEAISLINRDLIFYEPNKVNLKETWINQSDYAFVVSPHGNGYDTHRTWEALILGCIVIVKKSPLDVLYKDLPVLIVNEWSDINRELLDNTIQLFKNTTFNYEKITANYWKDLIKSGENYRF